MPSAPQLLFLFSFVSTFAVLYLGTSALGSYLRSNGWDINDLILIGLQKKDFTTESPPKMLSFTDVINTIKADQSAQAAAAVGLLTIVFILSKLLKSKKKPVLNPQEWKEFPLVAKFTVSPNTALYRFGLPSPDDVLGLPIGQHISVQAEINGKNIMRSYTPTSSDDDVGHFDLLVKSYEKGNISKYLSLIKIGDNVRVRGPKGQFKYHPTLTREIGMIAGGTGITPMLQIIRAALKNPNDRTKISLIYANVNVEDILLRTELDELAEKHNDRFKVYYVLNNPPPNWKGGVGFVTKDQIERHLPPSSHDIKVLLCGPPPMITAMKKHLDDLKYPAPRTVSKLEDQVFLF
ncbi:NADH-cytochrome b5 reductase [Fomitiporia mediterranea MF3/22]|uniref:NADH-cytochrome b5 reductase n=1 Tax=Fomitiporia mediterranea (strain MF3/22) TaxID=694068 RepID=UPI0004408506|nr:NADH-cytochrome b5 reductase [Fomitiporia mediterranea MF3/22]EJD04162.1 NADH-cytochrome b5 reductase [Fomitiporia mediterranea MF3/22]